MHTSEPSPIQRTARSGQRHRPGTGAGASDTADPLMVWPDRVMEAPETAQFFTASELPAAMPYVSRLTEMPVGITPSTTVR